MPNSSGAPLIVNSSNESNGDSVFVETNIVTERFAQYIPLTKYVSFNSSANGYSRISGSAITLQAAETVAMQTVFHISLSDTVQSPVFKYAGSTNAVQVDGHAIFDRDGGSTVIYINENSSITMTKALFTGSTFATLEVNARVVASATDTFAWYMKMSGAGAAAATVEAWTTYQKYL